MAVCLVVPTLGGCGGGEGLSFLHPHGLIADAQRRWLHDVLCLMAIFVIPVFLLVPPFAWRYRRSNNSAAYRPDWKF